MSQGDPRSQVMQWLRQAAERYGGDLGVPPARLDPTELAPLPTEEGAGAEAATPAPDNAGQACGTAAAAPPADAASALAALREEVSPCSRCKLHKARLNLVFGEGDPDARVMFVGEAPGQVEDETGRPFVGRSGELLDKIIVNAMGMRRQDVFIANINKCRPPGNRDPEPDEIASCLPWLREQIRIIRPEVIVTLGRVALWNLLGTTESMRRMRGRELSYEGTPVVATWHPAYLLRNPAAKGDTWDDIKRVNRMLGNPEVPSAGGGA